MTIVEETKEVTPELRAVSDPRSPARVAGSIEERPLQWHGSGSWIAERKPDNTLGEIADGALTSPVSTFSLERTDTNGDTVGELPTGFKPVEKKKPRKSSLFPLWT